MEEDISRQQKAEALNFMAAQSALPQHEQDPEAGMPLLAPCPFRVQISLSHLPGILTT
jgi:hypothetical protein